VDRDTARALATAAIKSSSTLTSLLPTLRKNCSPTEYDELRKSISGIAGDISVDVLNRIFELHPDLEDELDEVIRRDGTLP
jgi:hypothetical protein